MAAGKPNTRQLDSVARCVALACVMSLALGAVVCCADTAQVLRIPGLGVQMRVPEGWGILAQVEGSGVTLGPPGGGPPTLDVFVWEPVADELSAEAGALAHEQVLAARFAYTRQSHEPFVAGRRTDAILATGIVQTAGGERHASLFAAYVIGRRYFVVGTFCEVDEVGSVRAAFFDDAVRTFSRAGTRLPPGTTVEPAAPVTPVGPETPGPAARREPGVPPAREAHRDRLGFSIEVPRGWSVSVEEGCVLVWPPGRPRDYGAAIWPLLRGENAPVQDRARRALTAWAELIGSDCRILQTRLASGQEVSAVCAGELELDGKAAQALAAFVPGRGFEVLQVAVFHPEASDEDRMALATVLASFESVPLWTAPESARTAGEWVDREGALKALVDHDWVVVGGVRLYNDMLAIDIEGRHPRSGARFSWRQPELPCYKDLSQELVAAGWREGSEFPPDRGIEPLALARRPNALAACRQRILAGGRLSIRSSGPAPRVSGLLPGGEGAFAHALGAAEEASCLCSVADAPTALGHGCWMAARLRYEGPRGMHEGAGAALRRLILSMEANPKWPAREGERKALDALLTGAREAAADLPATAPTLSPHPGVRPLLDALVARGSPDARRIRLPENITWLWNSASDVPGARLHLPELLSEWWGEER